MTNCGNDIMGNYKMLTGKMCIICRCRTSKWQNVGQKNKSKACNMQRFYKPFLIFKNFKHNYGKQHVNTVMLKVTAMYILCKLWVW